MVTEHDQRIADETALRRRNPSAEIYMGQQRHYELAKSEAGEDFFKKGKPTQKSMDRALPGQIATALNMLSTPATARMTTIRQPVPRPSASLAAADCVFDINELIRLEALERTFSFKALKQADIGKALGDARYEVLQDKYAALVGYLKSARKFGLVGFEGQLEPMWSDAKQITSTSFGFDRAALLSRMKDDTKLSLIAESNLDQLRATLLGDEDELDALGMQVHGMMDGFLHGDETAVRAAMRKM